MFGVRIVEARCTSERSAPTGTIWGAEGTRRRYGSIDAVGVERLLGEGVQLVDVLPREEFEEEHLPGASSIPLKELDAASAAILDRDRPVIVYCYDYQ